MLPIAGSLEPASKITGAVAAGLHAGFTMARHKVNFAWLLFILVALRLISILQAEPLPCALEPSPALQPYVDPLPIMPRISLASTSASNPVVIGAYKTTQKLHRDLPATTVYAFGTNQSDAATPGPTLVALSGVTAHVRWENHIPDAQHMFPPDTTLDIAQVTTGVPLVVHQHGGVTVASSDGHPDAWFTMGGERGPNYTTQNYTYSNAQPATMLWYHDHTFGFTRLNVPAGLAGLYHIINKNDDPAWLPIKLREPYGQRLTIPKNSIFDLLLQDKVLFPNGSLSYPAQGSSGIHPRWCIEYTGDVMVVNGKVWPYLDVRRGVYRFRMLNGCNARFLVLSLSHNLTYLKVSVDGGYLSTPVNQSAIRIGPGERADVLIDFSGLRSGDNVTMENSAPAPFSVNGSTPLTPPNVTRVMMFRVGSRTGVLLSSPQIPTPIGPNTTNSSVLQATGVNVSAIDLKTITTRQFFLGPNTSTNGLDKLVLDGRPNLVKRFRDPPTEIVPLYNYELWEFWNRVPVSHPMHIHLINFVVLNRQPFDDGALEAQSCLVNFTFGNNQSCFTAPPRPPDADQLGWKDTAFAADFEVTRLLVPFFPRDRATFPFDPTLAPGYVWHCHILDHEDNEMIRPLLFVNSNTSRS